MEKIIEYGRSLGYDLRIIPNYIYLGYQKGTLSNLFSLNDQSFIVRILHSFNIQVRAGQLDQGGRWVSISKLLYSYGNLMIASVGSGSYKKIRRKIHLCLLQDNFQGVNISGVVSQELDWGEYDKYLDHLNLGNKYHLNIGLTKMSPQDLGVSKTRLEFTWDIPEIKRSGNDSDRIEWFEVEADLISSPFSGSEVRKVTF